MPMSARCSPPVEAWRGAGAWSTLWPASAQPPPHWSRYCANRFWTSDPKSGPAAFVEELRQIVDEEDYDVLLAGTDASLLAISQGRERLEPFVSLGLPAPEVVERSLSKVEPLDAATEAGVPAP